MEKLISILVLVSSAYSTCFSPSNEAVDWFVMLKQPDGYNFVYGDANHPNLEVSNYDLTSESNPVAKTIGGIYTGKIENYLMYNDEVPDGSTTYTRGHTKGVLTAEGDTVTWLIHSVPNFPPQKEKGYSYPSTARRYGQSFLCLTLQIKDLPQIAEQLLYTWPMIYDYNFDESLVDENLALVLKGKHIKSAPWTSLLALNSKGGKQFTSFAKFTDFDADLYSEWLATYFQHSFFTETWQNGVGKLSSNCSIKYPVKNIKRINILGTEYKETQDHSKWAISTKNEIICIGGINRMESQFKRAGGTVCFQEPTLVKQIRESIVEVEECSDDLISVLKRLLEEF